MTMHQSSKKTYRKKTASKLKIPPKLGQPQNRNPRVQKHMNILILSLTKIQRYYQNFSYFILFLFMVFAFEIRKNKPEINV